MQIINRLGHASKRTRVFCLLGSENIATHVYIYFFFEGELCRNGPICIVVNNPKQQQLKAELGLFEKESFDKFSQSRSTGRILRLRFHDFVFGKSTY